MNARVVVSGVVAVLLGVAGCGLVGQSGGGSADRPPTVAAETTSSPSQSQSQSPSPSPTVSTPSPSRTTPTVDSTAQLLAKQQRVLAQNPLYRVGRLPASRCKEPAVRPTSVANVRKYYAEFLRCLDKVWKPVVEKAGFTFQPVRLEVFTGKTRTLCSVQDSAAYCGQGTISMSADFDIRNYRKSDKLWTRATMAHLAAHEYAHHIQRLTGISAASSIRTNYLNGVDAPLQESRRLELQASCLSGAYLGADRSYFPVSGAWRERWRWAISHRGDEWGTQRDHGSSKNHSRWTRRGFDAAAPSACNTFTASAATVS
ncbi:neutral zinc metallopeptidase [Kribbella solani]|uniref:Putative metalloprotease n=1 Tax=Kribbella solani TaxID=236067 RepID=A0A841DIG3_9ACTN|nr:putative metalloprotease [Kribbella solani]